MADLKQDLKNKLMTDKFYEETELQRLSGDPTMNYKQKIDEMAYKLANLSLLNAQLGLLEFYFQPPVAQAPPVPNAPQGQVHPGQSHSE